VPSLLDEGAISELFLFFFTPWLISSTTLGITGELMMSHQSYWNPIRRISIPEENTKESLYPTLTQGWGSFHMTRG
jgi:hypothetical protein